MVQIFVILTLLVASIYSFAYHRDLHITQQFQEKDSVDTAYNQKTMVSTSLPSLTPLLSQVSANYSNSLTFTPFFMVTPTMSPSLTLIASPMLPAASPMVSNQDVKISNNQKLPVLINEIGWMGTKTSAANEWLELYNRTNEEVDLDGWILKADDNSPMINLKGTIKPGGYFLIERTDDSTIPGINADLVTSFGRGGLNNDGERLVLLNKTGQIIDAVDCLKGWFAGSNLTKTSMERKGFDDGSEPSHWSTYQGPNGTDILGTPRSANSVM